MPGFFITATGTDVGKTYVTAGLLRAARRHGVAVDALKPILTGYSADAKASSDAGLLLAALGEPETAETVTRISPWRFAAPLSPNMAAHAEGRPLAFDAVVATCRAALRLDRFTLMEGIGGVMVPLDDRHTVLDLIGALGLPVILVSGTGLGALSHCLTAHAVLHAAGRDPALIVLDESTGSTVPLAATQATLASFCKNTPITIVPRNAGDHIFDALWTRLMSFAV